jgi:hypothetical protein
MYLVNFFYHKKEKLIALSIEEFKDIIIGLLIEDTTIQDHLSPEEISDLADSEINDMISGRVTIPNSYGIIKIFNLI